LENSIKESEKLHVEFKENLSQIDQFEQTIGELNSRNHLLETKLIETMTLIDHRNKTLMEYEQQLEKIQNDCKQKHQDLLDKQIQIEQLEQNLIDKTAEVAQLSETLETDQVKNQHREKYAEDHVNKALNDIKTLQREVIRRGTDFSSGFISIF
jgi:predicted RNase H-like nuclease (RuvC/YqgF family)